MSELAGTTITSYSPVSRAIGVTCSSVTGDWLVRIAPSMTRPPIISALPWPSLPETNWARPIVPPAPGMLTTWMPLARSASCSAFCMARPVWSQPPPGAAGTRISRPWTCAVAGGAATSEAASAAAPAASDNLCIGSPLLALMRCFLAPPWQHVDGGPASADHSHLHPGGKVANRKSIRRSSGCLGRRKHAISALTRCRRQPPQGAGAAMFKNILLTVDLGHEDSWHKALPVALDAAKAAKRQAARHDGGAGGRRAGPHADGTVRLRDEAGAGGQGGARPVRARAGSGRRRRAAASSPTAASTGKSFGSRRRSRQTSSSWRRIARSPATF